MQTAARMMPLIFFSPDFCGILKHSCNSAEKGQGPFHDGQKVCIENRFLLTKEVVLISMTTMFSPRINSIQTQAFLIGYISTANYARPVARQEDSSPDIAHFVSGKF